MSAGGSCQAQLLLERLHLQPAKTCPGGRIHLFLHRPSTGGLKVGYGFPKAPPPYLLFKAVRGQEEAVQGYKVALQEPHEQYQVDPICKLHGEPGVSMCFLHQSGINPPKATSEGRLMVRESHKGQGGGGWAPQGRQFGSCPMC